MRIQNIALGSICALSAVAATSASMPLAAFVGLSAVLAGGARVVVIRRAHYYNTKTLYTTEKCLDSITSEVIEGYKLYENQNVLELVNSKRDHLEFKENFCELYPNLSPSSKKLLGNLYAFSRGKKNYTNPLDEYKKGCVLSKEQIKDYELLKKIIPEEVHYAINKDFKAIKVLKFFPERVKIAANKTGINLNDVLDDNNTTTPILSKKSIAFFASIVSGIAICVGCYVKHKYYNTENRTPNNVEQETLWLNYQHNLNEENVNDEQRLQNSSSIVNISSVEEATKKLEFLTFKQA